MTPELIGIIGVSILLLLMFLGVPIWVCTAVVGLVGIAILGSPAAALSSSALMAVGAGRDYTFAVLPIFLLLGELADISGIMTDAYRSANTWLGRMRGGLAAASVAGAAAFSVISGSSMATAAIMTRVALPQLIKHKYDPALAVGALSAGGTLGNLIPPGMILVIYAMMTEISLGSFFIALYIPGFLLAFMYMAQIYIQCKVNPAAGPRGESTTWKQKLLATKGMAPVLVVFVLTLGGIQFGVFTPNEAASISTIFVFVFAVIRRTVTGRNLLQAFKSTLGTTGMAFAIIFSANALNSFIGLSGLAQALASWLIGLDLSATTVVVLIMVLYFILGIPLNALTILLLTVPILLPVLIAYDINLLWFGVLAITQCELANLTPPVGMNLYVVASIAKPQGISMGTVFRGSIPFCVTAVLFVILLIAFPQISLFLVEQMK